MKHSTELKIKNSALKKKKHSPQHINNLPRQIPNHASNFHQNDPLSVTVNRRQGHVTDHIYIKLPQTGK